MSAEFQNFSTTLVLWAGLPPYEKFKIYMKVTGLATLAISVLLRKYWPKTEEGTIRCFTFNEVYMLILRF